eukprot:1195814-Prorocentrum_minimum.AAC.1
MLGFLRAERFLLQYPGHPALKGRRRRGGRRAPRRPLGPLHTAAAERTEGGGRRRRRDDRCDGPVALLLTSGAQLPPS